MDTEKAISHSSLVQKDLPLELQARNADSSPTSKDITIPDGGLRACLCVLGGALVQFCTFGYASSFGVYQDYYVLTGGFSSSNASWIGSIQFFLLFAVGLPAGKLFDAGYFRHLQVTGTLLYAFSLFMLSLANPHRYYQLILAQGIGMGIGSGLLLVPAISCQAHHWKRHRSLAMGIVLAGSSCGGIVYPIMLNQLINRRKDGFAWAVRATGFLTLGMLCIGGSLMTTRLPSIREKAKRQENEYSSPKPSVKAILTDLPYVLTLIGTFAIIWGFFFPFFYLQLLSNSHGLSATFSFYSIAILNAGSVLGRLIPNTLADRLGQFNVICPVSVISAGLVFAMLGVQSTGGVAAFGVIYGFFGGAIASLVAPVLASMAREPSEIGIRIGFGYFVMSFAVLTGSPIDGALLGSGNERHWTRSIVFSGVVMFVGAAILIIARYILAKKRNITLWGKL